MQVTVVRAGRFHTISPRSGPLRCRTPISRPFSTRNRTTPCIEPISANSVKTSRTKDHRHERPCPPGTVRGARLRAVWFVDPFWRDHAEAEDRVKAVKRVGLGLLPSKSRQLNAARVPAATIAADLDAWNRLLLLHDEPELAAAEPETISMKLYHLPARLFPPRPPAHPRPRPRLALDSSVHHRLAAGHSAPGPHLTVGHQPTTPVRSGKQPLATSPPALGRTEVKGPGAWDKGRHGFCRTRSSNFTASRDQTGHPGNTSGPGAFAFGGCGGGRGTPGSQMCLR